MVRVDLPARWLSAAAPDTASPSTSPSLGHCWREMKDRVGGTTDGPAAASVGEHCHSWCSELRRATRLLPATRLVPSVRLGRLRRLRVARGITGAVPR